MTNVNCRFCSKADFWLTSRDQPFWKTSQVRVREIARHFCQCWVVHDMSNCDCPGKWTNNLFLSKKQNSICT